MANKMGANKIGANKIGANKIGANKIGANEPTQKAEVHIWDIFHHYVSVMNDYLIRFTATAKFKKGEKDRIFLLINGFNTLTHIFKITLNVKQIEQAVENMEKAIDYYTQFIEQMEENILSDLNVSSNSASLFVYQKTLPTVLEPSALDPPGPMLAPPGPMLDTLILIYRLLFDMLLRKDYNPLIPAKLIQVAMELCRPADEKDYKAELANILLFIQHLPPDEAYYDTIYLYIKKYKKHTLTLEELNKKRVQPNYAEQLKDPNYIKWLLRP